MKFYKLASNDAAIINLEEVREMSVVELNPMTYNIYVLRVTFIDGMCQNYEYNFKSNAEADIDGIMMIVDDLYNDDDNNEETE